MSTVSGEAFRVPRRIDALWFWLRTRGWIALRSLRNLADDSLHRWPVSDALRDAPILAESRTTLWADADSPEFELVAGKVHNLRIAVRAFDGVAVPAHATLSFWRQLGRPRARRDFVAGRELREGCVVPVVAGGICQLSNALADCARRAGIDFVERHAHSARAADTAGTDATVFWNYVDLRLRAPRPWRMEAYLEADALVVRLRGTGFAHADFEPARAAPMPAPAPRTPRSCLSCVETGCFRHRAPPRPTVRHEAWLLDEWTPEFAAALDARASRADRFAPDLPAWLRRWQRAPSRWSENGVWSPVWTCLRNVLSLRANARMQGRRQAALIAAQQRLAHACARRLRPHHVHLVVAQSLLPHLWRLGVLGGRSFEVLAGALPMREVQQRLDFAHRRAANAADAATLIDFRADEALLAAEEAAFARADAVLTAHADVAAHWRARGVRLHILPWCMPQAARSRGQNHPDRHCVVFPASELARKGARELAVALDGLDCRVRVLGTPSPQSPWRDLTIEYARHADDWLADAAVVVLPAHVEHAPRALLAALAANVPVIATPACGIEARDGLCLVPAGDVSALRDALLCVGLRPRAGDAGR